ncbi:MAG: tripartite tricarboxylate transporter family receptor [Hyphomicrobiales bacterium]|nr:tripartite tricarboxylate transporter family receptor [Hyphomicrobiales bacterium]
MRSLAAILWAGALASAPLGVSLVATSAAAQDFYAGKTITFVIGFGVNNGYDLYSRMLGRHMGKHLAGRPNIVPQNMPGAGSLAAINYIYNVAPKDGTVLGMIDQAAPLTQSFGSASLKADVGKFNWIGRISDNAAVLYGWHDAPVQKISDAYEKELIIAAPGQSSRTLSSFLRNALGLRFRILTGYRGPAESQLAMERGEVHALTQPFSVLRAEKPEWLRDDKVRLLLQVGVDGHPDLKDVPLVASLARTDEERLMIELVAGNSRVGRAVMSPPGQPPARVQELRAAFTKTMSDPEYLSEIRRANIDHNPMAGEDLQKVVEAALKVSPELVARARKLSEYED